MSPVQFLKEVKEELERVHWPSKEEVIEATIGVVVFCAVIAVYFWALDLVFSKALELIIAK
ncbi:preprotein translocase subunit SecE [Thermovibrio sp.]